MKNNSKYLTKCLDHVLRPLVLVLCKNFERKEGDKDHNSNNKLMSFHRVDDKLLKKYRTIWSKIGTYSDKVDTNFHGLNIPKFCVKC